MTKLSADGGSATSQAQDLGDHRWQARPWVSRLIRLLVAVVPIIASVVATRVFLGVIELPEDLLGRVAALAAALAIAIGTSIFVGRLARRLLPLALLFRVSLAFPDDAPARFKVALRRGSVRQLETSLANGELDHADAADALLALVARVSAHDRLTRGHSERVRGYADLIAEELGLSQDDRDRLQWAALTHDVGKLSVPAEILNKPDRLTEDEWAVLRAHPSAAAILVGPLQGWLGDWALAAVDHHERWDGAGYPRGLAGTDISLAGRIVAVADAYDVMTSVRSYKAGLSAAQARAELTANAGSQFDPTMVRAFLAVGLGRLRFVMGPLAWLNELAWLARLPQGVAAAGGAVSSAVAATAVAVATVAAPVTESLTSTEPAVPAERVVIEEPLASTDDGDEEIAGVAQPLDVSVVELPDEELPPISTATPSATSSPDLSTTTTPTTLASSPTTAPASTTVPSSVSTTVPTTTTVTTTTSSSTTTTTTPPAAVTVLLGANGQSAAHEYLPFGGTLDSGVLKNYDTDRDSEPGLLVVRGSGLGETDPTRVQQWWINGSSTPDLSGPVVLSLYVATQDFDQAATGALAVGLYDCSSAKKSCVLLATGTGSFGQAAFGSGFGLIRVMMGTVDHEMASGRGLLLAVAPSPSSGADLLFAFGNVAYPSELAVG